MNSATLDCRSRRKEAMFFWIGLWLLASSWLFGLDYFFPGNTLLWSGLVATGTLLICISQTSQSQMTASAPSLPSGGGRWGEDGITALLLLPAALLAPWPYRVAPIVLGSGILLKILLRSQNKAKPISSGLSLSGTILFAQTLALLCYKHFTARSHELPWPLPGVIVGVLKLLGIAASADGSTLALPTMRLNHRLGATWELFLDPATLCFLGGAFAIILTSGAAFLSQESIPGGRRVANSRKTSTPRKTLNLGPGAKALGLVLGAAALWLPFRAGLYAAIFLHRALRTDYDARLSLMNQFWSPWPQVLLLLPLLFLLAGWLRDFSIATLPDKSGAPSARALLRTAGLAFAATALLTLGVLWDPLGARKSGRIGVDEFHSKWEPTERPMDTEWYGHLSGYNYACIYDFSSRYYQMSRLTNSLSDAALASLDVLILKVPTEKFQPEEIDAIVRFVDRGGGVLMIGEHTDVFSTGYNLNSISRHFGFTYRYDCLFGMESFFDQFCQLPLLRHPTLQYLRDFDFATSCSIDPGGGSGRGAIVSTGLKNSMADYHANNYYPQAVDHASMRYGAFVQLWATRHGRGRVLAFTDSTIFSNFSTFEPGKIEFLLGMLEWLNRQDRFGNPRLVLVLLGLALLAASLFAAYQQSGLRPWLLPAGAFGWAIASLGLLAYQSTAFPEPKPVRPFTWVTIDRTLCDGPLSKGGFIAGKPDGFGIFERWILPLGYFIKRRAGFDAAQGDLIVFFYPTRPLSSQYRQALVRYVENGGKILVIDSPKNMKSSAESLLEPFHLAAKALAAGSGTLTNAHGWPTVSVEAAHEIIGGEPLFRLNDKTVGAIAHHGKGSIVALGFGSRFADPNMGTTGDVVPDATLRNVFDLEFALLRAIVEARKLPAD